MVDTYHATEVYISHVLSPASESPKCQCVPHPRFLNALWASFCSELSSLVLPALPESLNCIMGI